jgi:hypothetical protein
MMQRSQLQQSLSAARQDYQSARLQAQEGFYQQNRDILTATGMRGLAESGQRDVANIQSQTAYGETVSGLYGQKQAVEQQAVQQQTMISEQVRAATTQANITRATQQLQSDTELYNQVSAISDNEKAQFVSLMELGMSGQYTDKQLQQLSESYGLTPEKITTLMNASAYFDPTGDLTLKDKWDWSNILETTGSFAAAGAAGGAFVGGVGAIPGAIVGAVIGLVGSVVGEATGLAGSGFMGLGQNKIITGSDGRTFEGNITDIVNNIKQTYASQPYSDQINVLPDGTSIKFYYNGVGYKTYNEARRAIESAIAR